MVMKMKSSILCIRMIQDSISKLSIRTSINQFKIKIFQINSSFYFNKDSISSFINNNNIYISNNNRIFFRHFMDSKILKIKYNNKLFISQYKFKLSQ